MAGPGDVPQDQPHPLRGEQSLLGRPHLRVRGVQRSAQTPRRHIVHGVGRVLVRRYRCDVPLTLMVEISYQDMIAHIPLASRPEPKKLLLMGGDDGGVPQARVCRGGRSL